MAVKFLQGFRGRETKEVYFEAGQIVEGDRFEFLAPRGIVEIIEDLKQAPVIVEPKQEPPVVVKAAPTKKGKGKR